MKLTGRQFVNALRHLIGLAPLYGRKHLRYHHDYGYLRAERLCQLADPDCARCGGSGYYDGDLLEMICACTGLAQRTARAGTRSGEGRPKMLRYRAAPGDRARRSQ